MFLKQRINMRLRHTLTKNDAKHFICCGVATSLYIRLKEL